MKWQPIDTAPKDGTEVLTAAVVAGTLIVRSARWVDAGEWLDEDDQPGEGWGAYWSYSNTISPEMLDGSLAPKYWAPMPELAQ